MNKETLALNDFFGKHYPKSKLNDPQSIGGRIFLRFELGDLLPNGTKERVAQATKRASTLFQDCFQHSDQLWMLIYDYENEIWIPSPPYEDYLYQLLDLPMETEAITIGEDELDQYSFHRKVLKIPLKKIPFEKILEAIANLEMGFEPFVSQRIFFIDPKTRHIFYIYDDRGCLIFSTGTQSIEHLYLDYNKWLVDFDREAIERRFQYLNKL